MAEGAIFCLQAGLWVSGTGVRRLLVLPAWAAFSQRCVYGWWPTELGEQQHGSVDGQQQSVAFVVAMPPITSFG